MRAYGNVHTSFRFAIMIHEIMKRINPLKAGPLTPAAGSSSSVLVLSDHILTVFCTVFLSLCSVSAIFPHLPLTFPQVLQDCAISDLYLSLTESSPSKNNRNLFRPVLILEKIPSYFSYVWRYLVLKKY